MAKGYQDLQVWQKSKRFAVDVYKITLRFPKEETYGITPQLRRASISIASNLAEGYGRKSRVDFSRFISIALGSANEVESLLIIANELDYLSKSDFENFSKNVKDVLMMLEKLRQSMRRVA